MTNRKNWIKTGLQNVALFMFSLVFILLIGEWLFPKYLNKVPFRLYGGVDNNLRVLAQYSKQSVIPENYIAIFGDSNSVGVGDLYIDLSKGNGDWYPDYAPAHFLHNKLETDVVSFGFAGAGSLDGIWSGPIKQFEYINSMGFDLKPPKTILVLFYEGNDIGNNLQFIRENYKGNEAIGELQHSVKFNEWLNRQFQNSITEYSAGFREGFVFTNFLIKSVENIFFEKSKQGEEFERIIFPAIPIAEAVIGGKAVPLPVHLQAPPLFGVTPFEKKRGFSDDGLPIGYYIFERAIKKTKEFFSSSEIKLIYLPSTLTSYKLNSPTVSFRGNMGDGGIADSKNLTQRHLEVCKEILKISQKLNISFFDTTQYLREASSKGYIHGPKDWDHLNESGYRALSDSISEFLLHPNKHYENCIN
ncbi:MAG: SGNH/GDSL hydrolase family protein [Nitrospina sp.]|jgi:lysophospholipase L1-like esterase|nr:SGNH/GDSL hydrolase family protein [Nitrospina sp.]